MKKASTTYSVGNLELLITVNEEFPDHISVHHYGEPCSGILKHWGSRKELINELKNIILAIESLPDEK